MGEFYKGALNEPFSSGGGADANAVHVNVASEISGVASKGTPTTNDFLLIEDVADGNNKKKITIGDIPSSGSASPLTTKGDLYSFDTDNARLPVGTNGQTLVADSSEAIGLKWKNLSETPAVGGGLLVDLGMANTNQVITVANGSTIINFDDTLTGAIDKNGDWDNTNKKFVVSSTSGNGTYQFEVNLFCQNSTAGYYNLQAFVNGSIKTPNGAFAMSDAVDDSGFDGVSGTISLDLVVGDEVEIKLQSYVATTTISANGTWNFTQGMRISKASGIKGEKGDTGAPTDTRVTSVTSIATLTIDSSTTDQSIITAQAEGLTIGAPTGAPVEGRKLVLRITDNGTNRALTWNAIFQEIGVTLPTTTTANKTIYVGLIYNATATKWDVVAIKEQV